MSQEVLFSEEQYPWSQLILGDAKDIFILYLKKWFSLLATVMLLLR